MKQLPTEPELSNRPFYVAEIVDTDPPSTGLEAEDVPSDFITVQYWSTTATPSMSYGLGTWKPDMTTNARRQRIKDIRVLKKEYVAFVFPGLHKGKLTDHDRAEIDQCPDISWRNVNLNAKKRKAPDNSNASKNNSS